MDCSAETECPYSAKKIYLQPAMKGASGWPMSVVVGNNETLCGDELVRDLEEQLLIGPYGRCVYSHNNDVCDNQVGN